jgi:thiamine-monophosphate kinase
LVREAKRLRRRAHAAIDISDGLCAEAMHLAVESGVRIVIDESLLRATLSSDLAAVEALVGEDSLKLAMTGGEDYALLATGPARLRPRGARPIGRAEKGRGAFVQSGDVARRLNHHGFDHFEKA